MILIPIFILVGVLISTGTDSVPSSETSEQIRERSAYERLK